MEKQMDTTFSNGWNDHFYYWLVVI